MTQSTLPRRPQPKRRAHINAESVLRAINPSNRRRFLVTVCFPLFVLVCLPWWWYTTSIERLPLPKERIEVLENARTPEIRTKIWLTADDAVFAPPPGAREHITSTAVKLDGVIKVVHEGVDMMHAKTFNGSVSGKRRWDIVHDEPRAPLRAHLKFDPTTKSTFPLEPYVKATDDGDLPKGTLVIPYHPDHVKDHSVKLHSKIALVNGINWILPEHIPEITNRALAYSPNITLSFVVLNEDGGDGSFVSGWDLEEALEDHFLPHLEPLSPVFNFSIESQVVYHAPLTFEPAQRSDGAWIVDDDQLKVFISERWSLDSASTNNPVLKFLLFVPSQKHRPMYLGEKESKAFLVPQKGSVILLNPPSLETGAYHLTQPALRGPFEQFVADLYSLLALPPIPKQLRQDPYAGRAARGLIDPLTPYQLDTILRMRLLENAAEGRKTLAGIVRLVDKIAEMKVGASVRDTIVGAVRRLEGLSAAARARGPLSAFVLSRDAIKLANEAFFDPSMMGLLYFPDEHKFAVYTPLFAPIGISMTIALLREAVAWQKRKAAAKKAGKEKKAADAAEDNGEQTVSGVSTAVEVK